MPQRPEPPATARSEPQPSPGFLAAGWLFASLIPILFFLAGWRTISLECHRTGPTAFCVAEESFAMGLHRRVVSAGGVSAISLKTATARSRSRAPYLVSAPAFLSRGEAIPLSSAWSSREDLETLAMREAFSAWMSSESPSLRETFSFISLYGFLGLGGIALLLAALGFHIRLWTLKTPLPRFFRP